MRSAKFNFGIALLLAGIISVFQIEAASAQLSISNYPLSVKGKIAPGETFEGVVNIINSSQTEVVKIRPEKENLMGGAEGVVELLGEKDTGWGISSWIKFESDEEFILAPKEQKQIKYKIEVPENAQPGGHFGAVLFRALSPDDSIDTSSGVNISGRVGTVLLFEVTGDIKKGAEISQLIAPKFIDHGPVSIAMKLNNSGNSYFTPSGKITFKNLWRTEEADFFNPGMKLTDLNKPGVVFPGFDRTYESMWNKKYLIGPVFITANIAMEEGGPAIASKTIIIWAFPWQEGAIILAILLVLMLGIKQFRKKFKIVRA